jgi:hypothetical protein
MSLVKFLKAEDREGVYECSRLYWTRSLEAAYAAIV